MADNRADLAKRSTSDRAAPSEQRDPAKARISEKKAEGTRALAQANDFWISCTGAFHMTGATGASIYIYPPPGGQRWHTTWRFTDDLPVGGRVGWTYKEDDFEFFMFFSQFASPNGKYELLWSGDNVNFNHYAWAD